MSETRPLAIHPWPVPQDALQRIQEAFSSLRAPFPVQPRPAVPGGPVRVLALGSLPPFICNAGLVRDPSNVDSIRNALRWVLDESQPVENGFTDTDYLKAFFGPEVRYIETVPAPDMKVRFE